MSHGWYASYKLFNCKYISEKKYKINHQIRVPEVRLVYPEKEINQVVSIDKALELAAEAGLDLVEVSPKTNPPVCKILDYGQLLYANKKLKQNERKKQKTGEVKGIRISYNMGKHDIEMRTKQTTKFLEKGNKVKIEMILRGRQKAHPEHVKEVFDTFMNSVATEYNIEQPLKRNGHKMILVLTPMKK